MRIECFICGNQIPVRATKKQTAHFTCDPCGVRCFVNRPEGIAGLESLAVDGEPFEVKGKAPVVAPTDGSPQAPALTESSASTIIAEIKGLKAKVGALEAKIAEPRAPAKKQAKRAPQKSMTIREYVEANA